VRIDYEAIVAQYEKDMEEKLRGFRPAHEFLEMWVHDEDPARSLLNMAEAAQTSGLEHLDIYIGERTTAGLDTGRLREFVSRVGTVDCRREGSGLLLKVSYGGS
jgi:hypothetical protein